MNSNLPAEQKQTQTPLEVLTSIQRLYVEGRLNGLPPKEAGRFAGMAEKSLHVEAYRMDKHPKVRAAIEYVLTSGQDVEITREYVTERLKDALNAAKDATELTNAAREMGKLHGLYAPEVKVDVQTEATLEEVRSMTDKQLMELDDDDLGKLETKDAIDAEFEVIVDACKPLAEDDASPK